MRFYKKINKLADYLFIVPAFIFMALLMVYPVLYNFRLSIYDVNISNLISGDAEFVGIQNFKSVLDNSIFWQSSMNTFVFMVGCLSFQFIIGMALALFFNQKFAGNKWMRSVVLVGWMNPIIVTGAIFKWIFSGDSGILNYALTSLGLIAEPISWLITQPYGLVSITLTNIWIGIPFNMMILLSGLQGLPQDVYESAEMDGATKIQQFFKITMPLLQPTIAILLMMGIIYTFKVFDLIYIMTKGGPARTSQTLPYFSYELSFQTYKFGEGAAVSVLIFMFIMVFGFFYLRTTKNEGDLG
ncbi:MAG: sugar ABC transporter permease [Eubacteriales bacterium]